MIDGEVEFKFGCHKETTAFVKEKNPQFQQGLLFKKSKELNRNKFRASNIRKCVGKVSKTRLGNEY